MTTPDPNSDPPTTEPQTTPPDPTAADIDSLRNQLEQANRTITALERRQRIDALLTDARAVDLEAARLLTEAALADMTDADLEQVIDDLKRHRPYLFDRTPAATGIMPAHLTGAAPPTTDHAADHARQTGHPRDLLRYLRLRRTRP